MLQYNQIGIIWMLSWTISLKISTLEQWTILSLSSSATISHPNNSKKTSEIRVNNLRIELPGRTGGGRGWAIKCLRLRWSGGRFAGKEPGRIASNWGGGGWGGFYHLLWCHSRHLFNVYVGIKMYLLCMYV